MSRRRALRLTRRGEALATVVTTLAGLLFVQHVMWALFGGAR